MNKILLVGGTGYIGSHLNTFLVNSQYDIYVTGTKDFHGKNYYQIDFNSPSTFNNLKNLNFNLVVILASSLTSITTTDITHPDLLINTVKYSNFLQYLNDNKITQKIIYLSSMTVYDENAISPVQETSLLYPLSTYGLSKQIAENITSFFCLSNNINGIILRIPGVYGGNRQKGIIYNSINELKNGNVLDYELSSLGYWETIHIDDLLYLIKKFIKYYNWDKLIEVYNLCYGEETNLEETFNFIQNEIGITGKVNIKSLPKRFYMSNDKLKNLFNFDLSYYSALKNYIHKK
jgi:UDP-glucose 4-epimerase